jgi:hypothetical protein
MVTIDPIVLKREGYKGVVSQNDCGEITLLACDGRHEVFAVRDSYAGWSIPTVCGRVLEFCRSMPAPKKPIKPKKRRVRSAMDIAAEACGMVKVRGALGGVYYE